MLEPVDNSSSRPTDRDVAEQRVNTHSSEYFKSVLAEINDVEPTGLRECTRILDGGLVYIVIETCTQDESFYLVPDTGTVQVTTAEQQREPAVSIRLTPAVVNDMLQGELTPIEAFFMGRLRARGTTRSLYAFLQYFIRVAQLGVTIPATLDLILRFQDEKN